MSVSKHSSTETGARRRAKTNPLIGEPHMVLPIDGLMPFTQPSLNNEQDDILTQLYNFAWDNTRNYNHWLQVWQVLDNERQKAIRIEAEAQRQLNPQVNPWENPQPPPQLENWGTKLDCISSFSPERFHRVLRSGSSPSDLVELGPTTRRKKNKAKKQPSTSSLV